MCIDILSTFVYFAAEVDECLPNIDCGSGSGVGGISGAAAVLRTGCHVRIVYRYRPRMFPTGAPGAPAAYDS